MRKMDDGWPALTAILSAAQDWTIGDNGKLPWRCPEDMKHFRETTRDAIVVMGSVTWASLPGRLRGRHNVVLSRTRKNVGGGVVWIKEASDLILHLSNKCYKDREAFLIGGAITFKALWDRVDQAVVTRLDHVGEGDTKFDDRLLDGFIIVDVKQIASGVQVFYYSREDWERVDPNYDEVPN